MSRISTRAAELSERLAQNAQAVCRHYLPAGRREGRYWMVGDVAGAPGRSLYVRLFETERGRIGNWVDAATGEHGDLVDLIRLNQRHGRSGRDHRRGRTLPQPATIGTRRRHHCRNLHQTRTSRVANCCRRLFAASKPLAGSLAANYLRSRGITRALNLPPCASIRAATTGER
jgi:hypothetical protein